MSDVFYRGDPQDFDRINDNIYFDIPRPDVSFEVDDTLVVCSKQGDPELVRRPDDPTIDHLSDRYPNLKRPADNPTADRPVDNPELDRQ